MYTQEDVRKLFMQRGEIEMELKVRQAQYYGREAEIPSEMAARVMELQRELMTIDGFFAALSENEAFTNGYQFSLDTGDVLASGKVPYVGYPSFSYPFLYNDEYYYLTALSSSVDDKISIVKTTRC